MIIPFLGLGILAGIAAGIFGIGGGIVLIPALVLLFKFSPLKANAISLISLLLPVGLLAVFRYYQAGVVSGLEVKAGLWIGLGILLGGYWGASVATSIPVAVLQKGFAILLVLVAVKVWMAAA